MRLICPNCDAQYEVPDEVMPDTGRDVQCSNCGKTWFQHHPDHDPEEDDTDVMAPPPPPEEDEEVAPPPPPPAPPQAPERKQLDPAVADILRQEAEAEQEARRRAREAESGLETQTELGLDPQEPEDEADRRAREARERMARMRGQDPAVDAQAEAAASAAALGSRRDLLPDIEEINSSLSSGAGRTGPNADEIPIEAPTRQRKRRGFRTGFMTVLLVAIVLTILYMLAPRLAEAVPALAPVLDSYVETVNAGRLWLDERVRGVLQSLDGMAERSAPNGDTAPDATE
ncbi:zinc-ribbon domain-containing protein [Sulfitobacter sp. S190]|uniref:zinc-ribbon domain-containing protein n=1 Tax=Sulfitobacter sp. S190 TaxID=2867022 RepID=UPI0021A8B4E3|nr:zinc-ribbon domain-containing protein [Sulfitobacter sp. S190]UWR21709.1 zinc-ribbon domain-containing protein [Sulfitobacter sp. S190]